MTEPAPRPSPEPHPCAAILRCPVCAEPLTEESDRSLRCPRRHGFDRAREGYVHLLPSGHGRSGIEGDAPEMVRSRRRFLERGFYAPISDAVNERALRHLGGKSHARVLDAGCGEGYYIGRLAAAVSPVDERRCFMGVDVSKAALRLAARSHPAVRFYVSDLAHRINVAGASVDLLLNVFAPRNPAEFGRVVRSGGLALVVIPDDDHLRELRAALPLLQIEEDKRERTIERLRDGFDLEEEDAVVFRAELGAEDVRDLIRMMPSYRHLEESELARAAEMEAVEVTVAVRVLAFRRKDGHPPVDATASIH